MANKSKETKVRQIEDSPHFSKVSKVYVTNQSGGGDFDGTVDWESITNKPETFPSADHDHDDRYNTKEDVQDIVDYAREQMQAEQGKVMAHADDEPAYLDSKVDNVTAVVEGNELKVKSIDGLSIGAASINSWLSGTEDNIQTQIDSINDSLVALSSGMRYMGKFETYAELQAITTMEGGDLAVVLADETRGSGRSMYVYRDDLGVWDFIGEFTFSDEFIALKDTPTNYADADGKVVKVAGERLVFDDVDYGSLKNRPSSTITDIDDAVVKRHEHSNADSLSKLGVNERGELTINGVVYVPKIEPEPKQYLYARRSGSIEAGTNWTFRWNEKVSGNIPLSSEGVFTLEKDKVYSITVDIALSGMTGWHEMRVIDVLTRLEPPEAPNNAVIRAINDGSSSKPNGTLSLIIKPDTTRNFGVMFHNRSSSQTTNPLLRTNLSILKIVEI